ncbi:MAG: hypothetical protein PHR06_00410, partial [Candidatus Cloacimonetes bacterium]|nr:hypothetical protein [Candidatus Cloacimonadota bacterium]
VNKVMNLYSENEIMDDLVCDKLDEEEIHKEKITEITSYISQISSLKKNLIQGGSHLVDISLLYAGNIYIKKGDKVEPGILLGENKYEPPKMYVISLFGKSEFKLNSKLMEKGLMIKVGDKIEVDQKILDLSLNKSGIFSAIPTYYNSPVRGIVERINCESGTIIVREIQDYSLEPVVMNIAKKLNVKPENIRGYLKKKLHDFVYAGQLIAFRIENNLSYIVKAESSGTITEIDTEKGTLTIKYQSKPFRRYSLFYGKLVETDSNGRIVCEIKGIKIEATLGYGRETAGYLIDINNFPEVSEKSNYVVFSSDCLSTEELNKLRINNPAALIVPSLSEKDLITLSGYELDEHESSFCELPFSVILTEGFGDIPMKGEIQKNLNDNCGKWIYVNTETKNRTGVRKPYMIIQESQA